MPSRDETATARLLALFPAGTTLDAAGELVIGGCRASDLAASFGTPAYIVDETALRHTVRCFRDGLSARWPNSQVVWASKSAPSTAMYRLMAGEGLAIDVAGGGELFMALKADVNPRQIVMHGNAKTEDEISCAVSTGVGLIVVDNLDDIDRLERLVVGEQAVLVRVIPEIDAGTHSANATGHAGSKFGLEMADAVQAMERIRAATYFASTACTLTSDPRSRPPTHWCEWWMRWARWGSTPSTTWAVASACGTPLRTTFRPSTGISTP